MLTAICVQYRAGATAAQAKKDQHRRTRNSILKHKKVSISYADIEGAFVDIDKSSILGYNNIEVLNFDISIDVSSISYCVDIEVPGFNIEDLNFRKSYWFDVEGYNIRY